MGIKKSQLNKEQWEKQLEYHRKYRAKNRKRIREINKKWRDTTRKDKWDDRNKIARHAHKITEIAIKKGILVRKPCEVCGTKKDNRAHHDDYYKPLEIRWFCEKHHREYHNKKVIPL